MDNEQEEKDPHPDFTLGFNEGYSLSAYAPEVGALFGAYAPESERGKGFRHGKEQYAFDDKSRAKNYDQEISDNKKDIGIKDSPEKTAEKFMQTKSDMGMEKSYPTWLQDFEQNKSDMGIEHEPTKDTGDLEPDLE